PTCPEKTLAGLIAAGDRAGIRDWAAPKTIAEINAEVAALDAAQRDQLASVILDSNADAASRDLLLRTMRAVLAKPDLGFYAEIWSYTYIEMVEGGFFGTCGHLFLSPTAWPGLSERQANRGVPAPLRARPLAAPLEFDRTAGYLLRPLLGRPGPQRRFLRRMAPVSRTGDRPDAR